MFPLLIPCGVGACSETRAIAKRMEEDLARAEAADREKEAKKQAEKLKVAAELQKQMAERNQMRASAGVSEYVILLSVDQQQARSVVGALNPCRTLSYD